jgi:hypothetical protein
MDKKADQFRFGDESKIGNVEQEGGKNMIGRILSLAAMAALMAAPASAAFVTSLSAPTAVTMPTVEAFGAGPQAFGPMTWTSDYGSSVFGFTGSYGFSNGNWSGTPMAGLNRGGNGQVYSSMTFKFNAPTKGVLAQMNWALGVSENLSVIAAIYDSADNLLEFAYLANNGNVNLVTAGGYYGFERANADIGKLVLSNGYIGARNFSYISSGAVPEPANWALIIGGFGLAGAAMRRRRSTVRVTYA